MKVNSIVLFIDVDRIPVIYAVDGDPYNLYLFEGEVPFSFCTPKQQKANKASMNTPPSYSHNNLPDLVPQNRFNLPHRDVLILIDVKDRVLYRHDVTCDDVLFKQLGRTPQGTTHRFILPRYGIRYNKADPRLTY